jgi:signal transduction histidine kinase
LNNATLDIAEFYFVQQGELISTARAGDTVPFSEQLYPYRFPVVPFDISFPASPLTIYIKAESRSGVEVALGLSTYPVFASSQLAIMMFYDGILALFLLSFFACITLYLTTRQHQFRSITLFFASIIPYLLAQTGTGKLWLWGESIEANTRIALIAACAILASFCFLSSNLQFESKYRGRLNIVLRFVFYIMLLTGIYSLLVPFEFITSENYQFLIISALAVISTVMAMSAISTKQGSKTALYLLFSWLLIFFVFLSIITYKLALTERAGSISVIGEVLLIIAALSILMSAIEFIRTKSEELAEAKMETKAKGDFLRNLSREFLTPGHLILSNSKRLLVSQSGNLDEATQQHMTTVINQSNHLHNLINDLLEMAEIESDNFEPEIELLEMSSFLNEIKNLMSPLVLEKGLELNSEYATDNLIVQTDKSRLQHVLVSVITNAIKYTESGSILLSYKAAYFQRKLGIEISVEDTGRGMSKGFQQQLFKEFSREEEHEEMEPKGTGLGLVIVKGMIEKMGGEISLNLKKTVEAPSS